MAVRPGLNLVDSIPNGVLAGIAIAVLPVQLQIGGERYDGVVGSMNWTVGDITAQVIIWDQIPEPLDPDLWNWGD